MARPRASRQSGDTRRAVLDAALALFARRGYHGAGMAAIAAAVGISKASLYWHFRSKSDLFRAVFAEQVQAVIGSVLPAGDPAAHPAEALRAVAARTLGLVTDHPDSYRLLLQLAVEPPVAAIVADLMDEELRAWSQTLAPAFDALGDPAPETAARVFAATLDGLALQALADPAVAADTDLIDAVVARAATHAGGGRPARRHA